MLEQRIADRSLIRIIRKWLKAGVMEELTHWSPSHEGTPQGGVISPLLGNIYLHFVQDLWIKKVVAKQSKGSVLFRRYADDSIVCFERKDDAEAYLRALPGRLAKFGLQLAEEKSSLVKFNRWEGGSSGKFTFLGFDFYWGESRHNSKYWRVRRTTNAKKFRAGLAALKEWLKNTSTSRQSVHQHCQSVFTYSPQSHNNYSPSFTAQWSLSHLLSFLAHHRASSVSLPFRSPSPLQQ